MARLYRMGDGRFEIREAHRKARPRRWPVSPAALEHMRRYGVHLGEPAPYISEQLIGQLVDAGHLPRAVTTERRRPVVVPQPSRQETAGRSLGRELRESAQLPPARLRDRRDQPVRSQAERPARPAPQATPVRSQPQWLLTNTAPTTWSIEPWNGRAASSSGAPRSFVIGGSLGIDHPRQLSAPAGRAGGLEPHGSLFLISGNRGTLLTRGTRVPPDRDYFLIVQARSRQDLTVKEFKVTIPPNLHPDFVGRCGAWNVYRVRTPMTWDTRTRAWLTLTGYKP